MLRSFGIEETAAAAPAVGGPAARVLCALEGAMAADELVRTTGLDASVVAAALTELELAGLAVAGAGLYRRAAGR